MSDTSQAVTSEHPCRDCLTNTELDIEKVREYFRGDKFATEMAGCEILEIGKGYSKCQMRITPQHRNAPGGVMGGAIFTLADFALAVASNLSEEPSVSVSNTIEFMSGAKGDTLYAEAHADKSGRRLGFYTVDVTDNTGRNIARMIATCAR